MARPHRSKRRGRPGTSAGTRRPTRLELMGELQRDPSAARLGVSILRWRTVFIGAFALALSLGLLVVIWLLARPLALLFAAVVIADALAPLVNRLSRRVPRVLAVAAVYLVLLLCLAAIGAVVIPPLLTQARESIDTLPGLVEDARSQADRLDLPGEDRLLRAIASGISGVGGAVLAVPALILSTVLEAVLVVVISIYWLLEMPRMRRFALSFFPQGSRERSDSVIRKVGRTIGGYVRGTALDGLILGVLAYIGYLLIGVPYPLVLALLAGLAAFVPVVGPFVAAVPAVALALLDSPLKALIVVGFYVALEQLEGNVLLPNILRSQADISPLLVILALFVGASVGGMLGALVAIPLVGALQVLVLEVVAPAARRWTGAAGSAEGVQEE